MDKKNTIIGGLLIAAAFASFYFGQKFAPPPPPPAPAATAAAAAATTPPATPVASQPAAAATGTATLATPAPAAAPAEAQITTLENDYLAVNFTNLGGAIRDVALRKFPAELHLRDPYIFNEHHADPMLAFVDFPGLDQHTPYTLVSKTPTEIVYRAVLGNQVEVTRRYTLVAQPDETHDPYQLRHEVTLRNLTDQLVPIPRFALSIGTIGPVSETVYGQKIATGLSNGSGQTFVHRTDLESSGGLFGLGAHEAKTTVSTGGAVNWASIDNQFFTAILTPDQPGVGLITNRLKLVAKAPDDQRNAYGLAGAAQFDVKPLAAHGETKLGFSLYVGPKEYRRLSNSNVFKADQDKVMQFGFFKFFSQILLTLMTWVHSWLPNWGVAIILTTLILKIVFVPFTIAASRSARRMQKIQPEMQAIREKFKDNPQKMQAATMELFKQHKVNPLGGCIPVLITMPFFFGFFQMLPSAAELRFVPFLWAHDLAAPDTVAHVLGLPINIMPILMGATMIIQMKLTPQPSVDNAQAKMLKFMPWIFMLFCYSFSCSLALYSTINGLFSIGQQIVINRMKDDGDPATHPVSADGLKNVTPRKGGKR
ncbi:MAG: membrane protein insertase YidC [Verrucomicrobia bacterium]|nr:membrane protein insertase YidC [Verrucomicrobiota bacterium]